MAGDDVMLLLRDLLTLDHKQRPTAKDLLQRRLFEEE